MREHVFHGLLLLMVSLLLFYDAPKKSNLPLIEVLQRFLVLRKRMLGRWCKDEVDRNRELVAPLIHAALVEHGKREYGIWEGVLEDGLDERAQGMKVIRNVFSCLLLMLGKA